MNDISVQSYMTRAISVPAVHCCLTYFSFTFENYIAVTLGVGKVGKLCTSLIEKVVNPSIYIVLKEC